MKLGPLEVGGNVWCLGPLFVSGTRRNLGTWWRWPIQRAWVNEMAEPWRYGRGLGVRLPFCFVSAGLWFRQDIDKLVEHWSDVGSSPDINTWNDWDKEVRRGALHEGQAEAEGQPAAEEATGIDPDEGSPGVG